MAGTASKKITTERAKCDSPVAEFLPFAKGLLTARAAGRLKALADGPNAEVFAQRLVKEAVCGAPHSAACLALIGRFGKEADWAGRLRQSDGAGHLPRVQDLAPKDLEPVGQGIHVISPGKALPWLAGAYLRARSKSAALGAIEKLLLTAAPTTHALADALDKALAEMESAGQRITRGIAGRGIDALEKKALLTSTTADRLPETPLARAAKAATSTDAARLVSALLMAASEKLAPVGDNPRAPAAKAIAEAAWSDADEALGRALQDMNLVDRALDRLESAIQSEVANQTRRLRDASDLVLQSIRQAARLRRVGLLNKAGDHVPYDPVVHDVDDKVGTGVLVRIVRPAVVRGSDAQHVVLLKAEAELD